MYITCMCLCVPGRVYLGSVCVLNPQIIPYSSPHPPHLQPKSRHPSLFFSPSPLSIYLPIPLSLAGIRCPSAPRSGPAPHICPYHHHLQSLMWPSLHPSGPRSSQTQQMSESLASGLFFSAEFSPSHMKMQCKELHSHLCKLSAS